MTLRSGLWWTGRWIGSTTCHGGDAHMTRVIGYAPGAYDLFHIGHLNLLRHAAEQCDHLIVGVVSDEMLVLTKGRAPVIPLAERMEIVRSLRIVDEVHAEVVPDKIDTWREVGVEVRYFPYTVHTSSTALRRALAALESTPRAVSLAGDGRR